MTQLLELLAICCPQRLFGLIELLPKQVELQPKLTPLIFPQLPKFSKLI